MAMPQESMLCTKGRKAEIRTSHLVSRHQGVEASATILAVKRFMALSMTDTTMATMTISQSMLELARCLQADGDDDLLL